MVARLPQALRHRARRLRHPAAHPEGQCALVLSGDRYARRLAGRAVALEAGIRDWGLGIRNSGVLATIRIPPVQSESPIPNPESPIPAPMHDTLLLFGATGDLARSEEPTSELQSLMRNSYAVFCLKKKKRQ